jgi:hypothetical protein
MELLIGLSLAAIAVIMFYRLVERRHKIVLAKIVGGLCLLGVGGLAWMMVTERRDSARRERLQRSVVVTLAIPDSVPHRYSLGNLLSSGSVNRHDTLSNVSFRLCNRGSDTVTSIEFTPKTVFRGRSTEYDIVQPSERGDYVTPTLSSDYILVPGSCSTLTWSSGGRRMFVLYDSVVIRSLWVHDLSS